MGVSGLFLGMFLLSIAVSIDLMICGIAYGIIKAKTSFGKVVIVSFVNSALFGIALYLGYIIGQYTPGIVTMLLSIITLCGLGIFKILQSVLKKTNMHESVKNKSFTFQEALILGLGVAIDAVAGGFAAGIKNGESFLFCLSVFAISLVVDVILFYFGRFIGFKISNKSHRDMNWLGGVILIGLGISKIFW